MAPRASRGPGRIHPVSFTSHAATEQAARNGKARRDGTPVLQECPAAANVILCLSEIATNAVTHSRSGVPGGHFTVVVDLCRGAYIKVTVIDDGGSLAEGVHGGDIAYRHGLTIVQDLSAGIGIEGDDAGRAVWFVCGWTAS